MSALPPPYAPRRPGEAPRMRDTCGTLRDGWYVACTAAALGKKPLSRTIMEEDLVLWRGPDGAPNCLLDRCLHRNARLSEGQVESGLVVCPYHGWHYDRGGACVKVPSEGPCSAGLPGRRVPAFPVREASGLVWVWMGDPEAPRGEPFAVPFRQDDGWASYYMVTPFEADVTDCVENFMDVPHTVFTHAGWFRSKSAKKVTATVERRESEVLVTYDHSSDVIGFTHLLVNPKKEPVVHTDHFFMPNVTRVDYHFGSSRSFIITSQCTPIRPMETLVYTAISYRLGVANPLGRLLLPPYTRQVIRQDQDILKNQSTSLRRYGRHFANSEADAIHVYIESLRDHALAGGTGPKPKPARCEIEFHV